MRQFVRSSLSLGVGAGLRLPPGSRPARAGSRLPLLLGLASLRPYASLAQAARVDGRSRDGPESLFALDGGAGMKQPRPRSRSAPPESHTFAPESIQRSGRYDQESASMDRANRAARRAHLQTMEDSPKPRKGHRYQAPMERSRRESSSPRTKKFRELKEQPKRKYEPKGWMQKQRQARESNAARGEEEGEQAESLVPLPEPLDQVVRSLREKYPYLPTDLVHAEQVVDIIKRRLKECRIKGYVYDQPARPSGGRMACKQLTVAVGNGNSNTFSVKSRTFRPDAYLHNEDGIKAVVAQELAVKILRAMDERGLIPELWGGSTPDTLTDRIAQMEQSALLEVFDYCTRHLLMPKVTVEQVGQRRTKFTIELEEQGIYVTGVHLQPTWAEIAAAIKFKAAAEAYQLQLSSKPAAAASPTSPTSSASSPTSSPEPLVVRDQRGLSVATATRFHKWLSFFGPGKHDHEVETTKTKIGRDYVYFSQCRVRAPADGDQESKSTWKPIGPQIPSGRRVSSQQLAHLAGALAIMRENPSFAAQFAEALKAGNGEILFKHRKINGLVPSDAIRFLNWATEEAIDQGLPRKDVLPTAVDQSGMQDPRRGRWSPLAPDESTRLSESLSAMHERYLESDGLAEMRRIKSELPMNQYKDQIYRLVQDNVFSIIVGATGSGKTTQVPQIILEQYYQANKGAECEIICTQPRRIAAVSVASRVKDEMGPELRSRVGHHVRFDPQVPPRGGSVTFATTGILLLQLQNDPDSIMDNVSHLLIDEVHERDKVIDFTLTMLKNIVLDRQARGLKVPRITLMSATLDTELFSNYFQNEAEDGTATAAPILTVPGRTFPVAERYLDDILKEIQASTPNGALPAFIANDTATEQFLNIERTFQTQERRAAAATDGGHQNDTDNSNRGQDSAVESVIDWRTKQTVDTGFGPDDPSSRLKASALVAGTIAHVAKTTEEGAILVFMPGLEELQSVEQMLTAGPILGVDLSGKGEGSAFRLYMLHSSITDTQKTVFEHVPPGVRKIILSTNIAETSVTIPDVRYVIDTGKSRELQYDHVKRISALTTAWISKSNAKQRAGRAGRVQAGHYLALFSKERHRSMRAIGLPELLRTDLQTTCLDIRSSLNSVNVRDFLGTAIEPPDAEKVDLAMTSLVALGALDAKENLTALGRLLSRLPVHPALGKMIVLGLLFRCLDPILVIGAAAEERNLFVSAPAVRKAALESKRVFMGDTRSDHLAMYSAFQAVRSRYSPRFSGAASQFAYDNSVHMGAFKSIFNSAKQMSEVLQDQGLIPRGGGTSASDGGSTLFGGSFLNQFSSNPRVIKAILTAGLQPNFASPTASERHLFWRTADMTRLMVPSGSVALKTQGDRDRSRDRGHRGPPSGPQPPFPDIAVFSNLIKAIDGNSTFVSEVSVLDPMTAILCANEVSLSKEPGFCLNVNGWLPIYLDAGREYRRDIVRVLLKFREVLETVKASAYADLASGKLLHEGCGSAAAIRYLISEVLAHVTSWEDGGEANAREMLGGKWVDTRLRQMDADRMTRREVFGIRPPATSGEERRTRPSYPARPSSQDPAGDTVQDTWESWQRGDTPVDNGGRGPTSQGRSPSNYGGDSRHAYGQGYRGQGQQAYRQNEYAPRRSAYGEEAVAPRPPGSYAQRPRSAGGSQQRSGARDYQRDRGFDSRVRW